MADSQTNPAADNSLAVPQAAGGAADWDVLLDLGGRTESALHLRIRGALRDAVRAGRFPAGAALPASRRLAAELGCSRWAVTEAYEQLIAEGYLIGARGSATRVAWSPSPDDDRQVSARRRTPAFSYDLTPGLPDLRHFPRRAWADALRAVIRDVPHGDLGYPAAAGAQSLRETLTAYLVRTRGAIATPDDLIVTTSVREAVRGLCAALREEGIHAIACEDPGWTGLRDVIESTGLRVVPVPADDRGLRVDHLRRTADLRAVLVTPAHQFPLGSVLAPERRLELMAWARERDGVILEDDYDAEFRYDRAPVSSLQGMDPSRVVLLKSASKVLSPALNLGWLVVARRWRTSLAAWPGHLPMRQPPTLDQLAFARLLESGAYDRHLRGCRTRYRRRRDRLVSNLAHGLPGARVIGSAAGLHLVVLIPRGTGHELVQAAGRHGVQIADLAAYRTSNADQLEEGIVIGYGNILDSYIDPALRALAQAWNDVTRRG